MASLARTTAVLGVEGMTCQSCVSIIQSGVQDVEGVVSVLVSLEDGRATVVYDGSMTSTDALAETIEDMGFVFTGVNSKRLKRADMIYIFSRNVNEI